MYVRGASLHHHVSSKNSVTRTRSPFLPFQTCLRHTSHQSTTITPLGKPLPNALHAQSPQGIPDQVARITSNRRTSREVAEAVQRGHIDADCRVQFACRARVGSRMLSVLIVTRGVTFESIRGPKPVFLSRGSVRCGQIGLAPVAPGELMCVPPAPTQLIVILLGLGASFFLLTTCLTQIGRRLLSVRFGCVPHVICRGT